MSGLFGANVRRFVNFLSVHEFPGLSSHLLHQTVFPFVASVMVLSVKETCLSNFSPPVSCHYNWFLSTRVFDTLLVFVPVQDRSSGSSRSCFHCLLFWEHLHSLSFGWLLCWYLLVVTPRATCFSWSWLWSWAWCSSQPRQPHVHGPLLFLLEILALVLLSVLLLMLWVSVLINSKLNLSAVPLVCFIANYFLGSG